MIYIGVIGESKCDKEIGWSAFQAGRRIAELGAVLVCGGMSGVMEEAARGAKSAGGVTIGILPGCDRKDANPYVDHAIVTGIGEARNSIVVRSSDGIVAVAGSYGTLSEIAYALKNQIPIVGIRTWELIRKGKKEEGISYFEDPIAAVDEIWKVISPKTERNLMPIDYTDF